MKHSLAVVFFVFFIFSCKTKNESHVVTINSMANRTFEAVLSEYQYDVAVINYFATYCSPCKKELPLMEKLHSEFKDKRVIFLSFTTETEAMEPSIRGMMKLLGVTYPVYYNAPSVFFNDAISVLPVTYILNGNNEIVERLVGLFQADTLKEIINTNRKNTSAEVSYEKKVDNVYYTAQAVRDNDLVLLSFHAKKPYKLGGEEYPPMEITINGKESQKFQLAYSKDGYSIRLQNLIDEKELSGHIKAFACTESNCFVIDENFIISVE